MTSVPPSGSRPPIDRTKPPYKDDPVVSRLTDDQVWALAELMARLATSHARRLAAKQCEGER